MRPTTARRALLVFGALLATWALVIPPGAMAARPDRPAVHITSPAAGSTGSGRDLTVSGTARGATSVFVTIGEDVNTDQASVLRSDWSTFVNEQPAGATEICAEAYDGAAFLGRTCITYTVAVDGIYLSLFPDGSFIVQSTFTATGGCHGGSTVRLTLDGASTVLPCVEYSFQQAYVSVPEGSHTLTAEPRGQPHPHRRTAGPRRDHRRRLGYHDVQFPADPGRDRGHHRPGR
jgi:hypothetical protein